MSFSLIRFLLSSFILIIPFLEMLIFYVIDHRLLMSQLSMQLKYSYHSKSLKENSLASNFEIVNDFCSLNYFAISSTF